jgi:hypothetical protein
MAWPPGTASPVVEDPVDSFKLKKERLPDHWRFCAKISFVIVGASFHRRFLPIFIFSLPYFLVTLPAGISSKPGQKGVGLYDP